jgi:hypothetical protein
MIFGGHVALTVLAIQRIAESANYAVSQFPELGPDFPQEMLARVSEYTQPSNTVTTQGAEVTEVAAPISVAQAQSTDRGLA